MKNIVYFILITSLITEVVEGMLYYSVPSQQFREACQTQKTDEVYDNDTAWQDFKSNRQSIFQEEELEKKDLSQEEISRLELEGDYQKKAGAFERAFFGNEILYEKFQSLVNKDPKKGEELASLHSEFFRWLIQNYRGNYEEAKVLVGLYKSLKNFPMYVLWKNIAIAINLPVEKI